MPPYPSIGDAALLMAHALRSPSVTPAARRRRRNMRLSLVALCRALQNKGGINAVVTVRRDSRTINKLTSR